MISSRVVMPIIPTYTKTRSLKAVRMMMVVGGTRCVVIITAWRISVRRLIIAMQRDSIRNRKTIRREKIKGIRKVSGRKLPL